MIPAHSLGNFCDELAAEELWSLYFYFYPLYSVVQLKDKDSDFYLDLCWGLLCEMPSIFSNSLSSEYKNCHPQQNTAVQRDQYSVSFSRCCKEMGEFPECPGFISLWDVKEIEVFSLQLETC